MRFYVFNSPIKWQLNFKFRRPLTMVFIFNSSFLLTVNFCVNCVTIQIYKVYFY